MRAKSTWPPLYRVTCIFCICTKLYCIITSNSPAQVQLHPSFERTLKLRKSLFLVTVSPDLEVGDPEGRRQTRSVNVSTIGHHSRIFREYVKWKPEDKALKRDGKVEVSTSNSHRSGFEYLSRDVSQFFSAPLRQLDICHVQNLARYVSHPIMWMVTHE